MGYNRSPNWVPPDFCYVSWVIKCSICDVVKVSFKSEFTVESHAKISDLGFFFCIITLSSASLLESKGPKQLSLFFLHYAVKFELDSHSFTALKHCCKFSVRPRVLEQMDINPSIHPSI